MIVCYDLNLMSDLLLHKKRNVELMKKPLFYTFDFLSFRSLKMQAIKQIKTFLWKVVDLKCEGLFNCIFRAFKVCEKELLSEKGYV